MRFFKKELVSRPLYLPGGSKVGFVNIGDDTGLLATEDGFLIAELSKMAARHKGGVVEITAEAYTDLKKNPPTNPASLSNSNNVQELRQQIRELQGKLRRQEGNAAGDRHPLSSLHVETPPISVPRDIPRPVTRRMSEVVPK